MTKALNDGIPFDRGLALTAAYASQACYSRQPAASRENGARVWKAVTAFRCDEASCRVGQLYQPDSSGLLVAFRGTEGIIDLLHDLDFEQVAGYTAGNVHQGFFDALESLWQPLFTNLRSRRERGHCIYLTGHSAGGALAILAAARLLCSRVPVGAVYTFGAPRVGDRTFVRFYSPTHYRFEHGNDLVPHLPLPPILSAELPEYVHSGVLKYLPRGECRIQEFEEGWFKKVRRCVHEILRTVKLLEPFAGQLKDHDTSAYVRYLEQLAGMFCPKCHSAFHVIKRGIASGGGQRYLCRKHELSWTGW
jgi:hypothetical protein